MVEFHDYLLRVEVPDANMPSLMQDLSALLVLHHGEIPDAVYHAMLQVLHCRGDSACLSSDEVLFFSDDISMDSGVEKLEEPE